MRTVTLVALAGSTVVTGVVTVLLGAMHRSWFGVDPLGATVALCGCFLVWVTYTFTLPIWLEGRYGLRRMQKERSRRVRQRSPGQRHPM